ncbi:NmrA family transcriptional regulator [Rhizobium sp. Root73]|uniref:SDR family oxidoreductase n=1 Tax=unclassified Rhizobium TaxID=2613769 RepID=UPI0007148271|nr:MULTISPECIES: SDR family oxidoreductase [unclassified Rhizobium]KQY14299.1 NmrA family transcriptional regulator [Rhizobium sp. Root1334]KQY26352.1 NmrA family transcriptional regulator [Rhizobium sp. Root483D2]KRC06186.1 NmrA family transcriptional regulator [Rhizobium sp. Root73]
MKIVVIGGTGLIGSKLVRRLQAKGHDVIAASPASGVNTITGEGLAEALLGAQVVVDVANSPSFEDKAVMEFFQTSGRNLLTAEVAAGIKHHVALSVVGTERLQASGYFRAKLAQEALIKESNVPYTLVHSTQFFEFMFGIAQSGTQGDKVHLSPALMQPIVSDDVADALADLVVGAPTNGIVEIAGPESIRIADAVTKYLRQIGDSREIVVDGNTPYFGAVLDDRTLMPSAGVRVGTTAFSEWVKTATPPPAR